MDKDDTQKDPDFDVLEASSEILGKHGKSDEEIKAFLEEHFPISAALIDKVLDTKEKTCKVIS